MEGEDPDFKFLSCNRPFRSLSYDPDAKVLTARGRGWEARYRKGAAVGSDGAYGKVHRWDRDKSQKHQDGRTKNRIPKKIPTKLAVKEVNIDDQHYDALGLEREVSLMTEACRHGNPNIVYFYGSFSVVPRMTVGLIMEYCEGDLRGFMRERGPCSLEDVRKAMTQLFCGLVLLHALGIVHRDLKPANILTKKNPDGTITLKITDFGLSRHQHWEDRSMSKKVGTPCYQALEVRRGDTDYDYRVDVWSLGVIALELFAGERLSRAEVIQNVKGELYEPPFRHFLCLQLMSKEHRASANQLLEHSPFLQETAFDAKDLPHMVNEVVQEFELLEQLVTKERPKENVVPQMPPLLEQNERAGKIFFSLDNVAQTTPPLDAAAIKLPFGGSFLDVENAAVDQEFRGNNLAREAMDTGQGQAEGAHMGFTASGGGGSNQWNIIDLMKSAFPDDELPLEAVRRKWIEEDPNRQFLCRLDEKHCPYHAIYAINPAKNATAERVWGQSGPQTVELAKCATFFVFNNDQKEFVVCYGQQADAFTYKKKGAKKGFWKTMGNVRKNASTLNILVKFPSQWNVQRR